MLGPFNKPANSARPARNKPQAFSADGLKGNNESPRPGRASDARARRGFRQRPLVGSIAAKVHASVVLSIVVPVFNERDNIGWLVDEIAAALRGRFEFEIIYVDDGSGDDSLAMLKSAKNAVPELRVLHHVARSGQSTAIRTGVKAARADWVVTLDGDGQNDPADIPKLLVARDAATADTKLFAGWRVHRQDTAGKRWASRWANAIRSRLLRDATPDTGCGIKLFERKAFLELPYFDHMHRYLPALMQRAGWKTLSIPVNHRSRSAGISKYDNLNRALVGIRDLRGVAWLIQRSKTTPVEEL
ncbi:MAG TPA: glycosyltransferase family 2 protein [Pseudoxanthomonas sp.]